MFAVTATVAQLHGGPISHNVPRSASYAAVAVPRHAAHLCSTSREFMFENDRRGVIMAVATYCLRLSFRQRRARRGKVRIYREAMSPSSELQLTAADHESLRNGESILKQQQSGPAGCGLFVADVDAPPDVVFGVIEDFEAYRQMIPSIRDVKLNSRERGEMASTTNCTYKVSKFRLRVTVDHFVDWTLRLMRFDLSPSSRGAILREASGSWRVEPAPSGHPQKCRVWFRISLRASKLVPRYFVTYAASRALKRATSWLAPHVEQWSKTRQRRLN
eukprot:TRINITY_DN67546_c0_g1_i1.p1 TRINITY_DN67546_c0_g1~~TRINITY_DN67546_c0_g1_i1.p1  ORF type:complete len:293 (-),score=32.86 TRINITY_DN67546_c0_g1_i1:20-844(-)